MLSRLELLAVSMLVVIGVGIWDRLSHRAVAGAPAARTAAPEIAFGDPNE